MSIANPARNSLFYFRDAAKVCYDVMESDFKKAGLNRFDVRLPEGDIDGMG